MMADKKVERSGRERPLTPKQKLRASLSDPGTLNMAEPTHDKGKAALIDKYREREERWRREQAMRAQEIVGTSVESESTLELENEPSEVSDRVEGGNS
jgi:hypothetical protein